MARADRKNMTNKNYSQDIKPNLFQFFFLLSHRPVINFEPWTDSFVERLALTAVSLSLLFTHFNRNQVWFHKLLWAFVTHLWVICMNMAVGVGIISMFLVCECLYAFDYNPLHFLDVDDNKNREAMFNHQNSCISF